MALRTLEDVTSIDGFKVVNMEKLREKCPEAFGEDGAMDYHFFEEKIRPFNFIYYRPDKNTISFKIQNGPIKEVGLNGCQVTALIECARLIIEGLNKDFPCRENAITITKLTEACLWQQHRTMNRLERGVEGTNRNHTDWPASDRLPGDGEDIEE